jgi:hypothetical protein
MSSQTPTILIVYPPEFGCYPKFARKVNRILSGLDQFKILYISDEKKILDDYLKKERPSVEVRKIENIVDEIKKITHAIFFDDGEFLPDLKALLEEYNIILRIINIQVTKVINVDQGEEYDIYIGRGSGWGNPYAIGFDGDREDVMRKFKYDFDGDLLKDGTEFKQKLLLLKGKKLGCHCKPDDCHGDVLVEYLNSHDDGK